LPTEALGHLFLRLSFDLIKRANILILEVIIMTTKTKNLHFFRLELLRLTEDRNGDSVMSPLSIKEKNIYLDDLVKNHLNSNNALKVKKV